MSNFDKNNYVPGTHPDLPPPPGTVGLIGWVKRNLFLFAPPGRGAYGF